MIKMVHKKIRDSIKSCKTIDQLKTCKSFMNLPCVKLDGEKSIIRSLIKLKAIELNFCGSIAFQN